MFEPLVLNIKYYQGTKFTRTLKFYTDTDRTVLKDMTGFEFRGQIRPSAQAAVTAPMRFEHTGPGTIVWTIVPEDFVPLATYIKGNSWKDWVDFVYDIEVEYPGGGPDRFFHGTCSVSPEVTK